LDFIYLLKFVKLKDHRFTFLKTMFLLLMTAV